MKFIYKTICCFFILVFTISCSSNINIKGGMGDKVDKIYYNEYKSQKLNLKNAFDGISVYLDLSKFDQISPIEPSINYISNAFKKELLDNGAFISNSEDESNIILQVVFSKYITKILKRKIDNNKYETSIDCHADIINSINNNSLETVPYSLSGLGSEPSSANKIALGKLIKLVLTNKKLSTFISTNIKVSSNHLQRKLDLLAKSIFVDFNKMNFNSEKEIKIAFTGFKNDNNLSYSNLFQTSLQKIWIRPQYKFYSRNQLDKILEEYKLSLSGLLAEQQYDLGKLKSVDLIITGSIAKFNNENIIEAQIIQLKDGEIMVSNSISILD